ncbi:polycystic kidney disease protein 1-like 2 [Macrosteles quadrilineatus]|uniref:polycystic kidney disease protein 1-like 2 n=1 Tax=Macrosteles quadrilineatus TaxID=74068 RepID=UPI0023E0DD53|nr:polycystic kidney disease protein 1-like 2 [Macrosteles quadrilineatus]
MTGARFGAGTDAAVGVKIYGTSNDGRRHVLTSKTHEVMGTRGEDWFLIYEAESLGEISCLDIWHDNAGARPHWFCDSIIIYDLHHKNCYYFLVNDWITLSSKRFPQASLLPSTYSAIKSPPRVFLDYLKLEFHLSHVWLATVTRHARDPVTRVDRLAIIVSYTVVSMAASITLINMYDEALEIDEFSYSLTWLMVEMGMYTCIIAAIVAFVLMHLFRKIYKIIFYIETHGEGKANTKRVTRISIHEDYLCSPSTMSLTEDKTYIHYGRRHQLETGVLKKRTLCESVNLMLMPKPLVPVRLERDDPNVVIDKIWLYTSWITVSLITLGCLTMSILLSKNLPPVKTEKWLTVVALSIIFHVFILLPLKIICISALLAVFFKRIIYKDVYTFDPSEGKQTNLFGNVKYLSNLVHLRSQPTYRSLNEVFHEEHRQKMLRTGRLQRLYQLLVQLLFLIVLGAILTSNMSIVYQTNAHLRTLMGDFDKVHNTSDYYSYLQEHCEPYLFRYSWYNYIPLSRESELKYFRQDWLHDSVSRMIEKFRLRQFRVKPKYCKTYLNSSKDCAAPFGRGSEDTNDYIPYWLRRGDLNETDEWLGIELLGNWSYTRPLDDPNFSFNGETGLTYTSGGYKRDLKASREDFSASLNKLLRKGWLGHYTRAVLAQIKVYNTNTRLFSEVTLIAEHTVTGQILPKTVVHSVDPNLQLDWWLTVFILMVFMLCVRIVMLTNFVGVLALFKNWHRVHELLMTVNGLAVLVYLLLHQLTALHYVTEYQLHADELNSFDFYKITHYYFTTRALLCTLYILILLRFYSFWRFGRTVFRFFLTGLRSFMHIYWIFVTFMLFQLLTFPVKYISTNIINVYSTSNMFYIIYNYPYFPCSTEVNGLYVLCYMLSRSSVVAMAMFVCVFVHHYKSVRYELMTLHDDNHFYTLYQEIKRILSLPVIRVTHKLTDTMVARHEARKQKLISEIQSQMQSQAY